MKYDQSHTARVEILTTYTVFELSRELFFYLMGYSNKTEDPSVQAAGLVYKC